MLQNKYTNRLHVFHGNWEVLFKPSGEILTQRRKGAKAQSFDKYDLNP